MDFLQFVSQEWILITALIVLGYIYIWRERIKSGRPISPNEVTQLVNQGNAVLIDLRDAAEFKTGHIVGSQNIPYNKLIADLSLLTAHKPKTVILIDKIGQHAGAIGRKLGKDGFDVRRLSGGIAEWQGQNLPLIKGK